MAKRKGTEDKLEKTLDKAAEFFEQRADRIVEKAERDAKRGGFLGSLTGAFQLALLNLFVIAMAAGTIWFGWRGYTLTTNGAEAVGTVVEMTEEEDGEGGCCVYSPVIEFQANGRTYSFESRNASDPPSYQVGQQVEVIYKRGDPSDAAINSFAELWLVAAILCPATLLVGVVLNFIGFKKLMAGEPIWDSDE
jgi:hypothetical protein